MNDKEDKVSIIVPIHNTEKYLRRCINSIITQTYNNIQIILIDDGSRDCSLEICKEFAKKDSRIEVYHIANSGVVYARKLGLKMAVGKYIGFVDSDDYIEPDMFEALVGILADSNVDFVHSGYIEENAENKKVICNFEEMYIELSSVSQKINFMSQYMFGERDKKFISYSLWNKVFKSELIKKCFMDLPEEQQYGEDLICLCKCVLESKCIVLSKKAMYHYTLRKNSLSHLKYDEYMMKEIEMWYTLINTFKTYMCFNQIEQQLYSFLKKHMLYVISLDKKEKILIPYYYYRDIDQLYGKKIVLFGAGQVGKDYYLQISNYSNCRIVAWVDSNYDKCCLDCVVIMDVKSILPIYFDFVILAVKSKLIAFEMKKILIGLGVEKEKIKWKEPGKNY